VEKHNFFATFSIAAAELQHHDKIKGLRQGKECNGDNCSKTGRDSTNSK